jgi:hypothetical protein
MRHLEQTLETYMYSHCNMCNITVYFCNIKMKHLQHLDETSKTLEHTKLATCVAQCHIAAWMRYPSSTGMLAKESAVTDRQWRI